MSYGTSLGLTLPTINGVATEAEAAPLINTALAAMITRLEGKVTPAGMSMTSDLSMRPGPTSYGITNAMRVGFRSTATAINATTYPSAIYFVGGDLYANDAAGNQIRITAAGAVNIAATGGITGTGYGATSVEVNWDAVNTRYKMRSGAAADAFASVYLNDVQFNDGSGNAVTLGAPAVGADYTLTLPTAQSGSNNSVVQVSTAGAMSITGTPTVDSLTAAANGHVTVSGTGRFKHGTLTGRIPAAAAGLDTYSGQWNAARGYLVQNAAYTNGVATFAIPLTEGQRLLSVTGVIRQGATGALAMRVYSTSLATANLLGTATSVTAGGNIDASLAVSGLTSAASSGTHIVEFDTDADYSMRVYNIIYTYDFV
jgi:hypothetical protein